MDSLQQSVKLIQFDRATRHTPHAVLVFAWLDGGVVWVKHARRGWEVPGGKLDPGESPEMAAERESREESGVLLGDLSWVAEYALDSEWESHGKFGTEPTISETCRNETPTMVTNSDGSWVYKWVYVGRVTDVHAYTHVNEILDVQVFRPPLTPEEVTLRPDVSYVMKDRMFEQVWPKVVEVAVKKKWV